MGARRAPGDVAGRRSQAERTTRTTAALVEAAVDAIAEVGYQRATSAAICTRAGVSPGALYHHFGTRLDLIRAALRATTERRIVQYTLLAEAVGSGSGSSGQLLGAVREMAGDRVAMMWAELTMACRTDPALRVQLEDGLAERRRRIDAAAAGAPELASMEPAARDPWMRLVRSSLLLEAIAAPFADPFAGAMPDHREQADRALLRLAAELGAGLVKGT